MLKSCLFFVSKFQTGAQMSYSQLLVPELEMEMATTRRVIERIPTEKFGWKAHEKSNTMGWVVNHLAEIPGWVEGTLASDVWDICPVGGSPYQSPSFATIEDVLASFDANVAMAIKGLKAATDEELEKSWSLASGGQTLMTFRKLDVMRLWIISHTIHHRAILTVYMRLNDIPVPAVYGPSGDEQA
jgi:uncharacterized damage-inducible protein DinB